VVASHRFCRPRPSPGCFEQSTGYPNVAANWNVAPTQDAMVVRRHPETGERHLDLLRWGLLPHFTNNPVHARRPVNSRAETVATSGMFRSAFSKRRCLVPAAQPHHSRTNSSVPTIRFPGKTPLGCSAVLMNSLFPSSL
jgi:putative SOS response-associated peptidase YedK